MPKTLAPHPRLYASASQLERLRAPLELPALRAAARDVARQANAWLRSEKIEHDLTAHNAHLERARLMQIRIVTLAVHYLRTRQERYRAAALRHVWEMDRWKDWSWIAAREGRHFPDAIFDLSYGENAATLAIAYDWLGGTFSADERARFVDLARRRALIPFLKNTEKNKLSWWFGKPDTNWNTVCAGGAGMLALALYELAPESAACVARAEKSVAPFMKSLKATGGGWVEGIGYWNYGMRYAFMYLLSYERALGRKHPLLEAPETRATLYFPLDFCPGGAASSFGDVNQWSPLPFHYAAAERLRCPELFAQLDAVHEKGGTMDGIWPDPAELLVFHPRAQARPAARSARPVAKLYKGLDWALLADRWPNPGLYLAIRGGTTDVPHGHRDLTSFHLCAGGETFVKNVGCEEYLDSTFGKRRFELFETGVASKNMVLINGLGITSNATVQTKLVRKGARRGVYIESTAAMGGTKDGNTVTYCGRLFLLLSPEAVLIVDRAETKFPARMETRLHSFARVRAGKDGAELRVRKKRLYLAFASDAPSVFCRAVDAPTRPEPGANLLRFGTRARSHTAVTFATLAAHGACRVQVQSNARGIVVTCRVKGKTTRVRLSRRLS